MCVCVLSGDDPLAKYVAAVRAEVGGEVGDSGPVSASTITVDDWEDGPKQIEMYADILSKFPVKVAENVCANCDGRGVVVCGNCQGSGLQPRFLVSGPRTCASLETLGLRVALSLSLSTALFRRNATPLTTSWTEVKCPASLGYQEVHAKSHTMQQATRPPAQAPELS